MAKKSGRRILIVDDVADNRELYEEYLSLVGYRVTCASNGIDALDKVVALKPHVVVTDVSMPGMDGWEVTRRIKKCPKLKGTIVVILSGHTQDEDIQLAKKSGADDFVAKPCLPQVLAKKIAALLV